MGCKNFSLSGCFWKDCGNRGFLHEPDDGDLVFLRSFSSTLVVAIAIPISVVGSFLIITLMGRTINVIMLAGMAFYDVDRHEVSRELLDLVRDLTGFSALLGECASGAAAVAGHWYSDDGAIPIYAGVGDHQCSLLGAGLTPGDCASVNLGTGSQVSVLIAPGSDRPLPGSDEVELRPYFDADHLLRTITHKGDALMADEEGDRFDAGTEGTWATRKHRSFLIHSVAAAAARALFSALATESRNRRPRCLFPSAKPDRNFASIHRPDISSRRNAAMRNTLSPAP